MDSRNDIVGEEYELQNREFVYHETIKWWDSLDL